MTKKRWPNAVIVSAIVLFSLIAAGTAHELTHIFQMNAESNPVKEACFIGYNFETSGTGWVFPANDLKHEVGEDPSFKNVFLNHYDLQANLVGLAVFAALMSFLLYSYRCARAPAP